MKKISLTLVLVMFLFTGCFLIMGDTDKNDKDDDTSSYNNYRYRHDYMNRNIQQKSMTAVKPKSSTPDATSKVLHMKK